LGIPSPFALIGKAWQTEILCLLNVARENGELNEVTNSCSALFLSSVVRPAKSSRVVSLRSVGSDSADRALAFAALTHRRIGFA